MHSFNTHTRTSCDGGWQAFPCRLRTRDFCQSCRPLLDANGIRLSAPPPTAGVYDNIIGPLRL
jgi:hypothetical protein